MFFYRILLFICLVVCRSHRLHCSLRNVNCYEVKLSALIIIMNIDKWPKSYSRRLSGWSDGGDDGNLGIYVSYFIKMCTRTFARLLSAECECVSGQRKRDRECRLSFSSSWCDACWYAWTVCFRSVVRFIHFWLRITATPTAIQQQPKQPNTDCSAKIHTWWWHCRALKWCRRKTEASGFGLQNAHQR